MRIIPRKTKIATEFFRGVTLADIIVGFFGILVMCVVFLSTLPGKLWIEIALFFIFGLLLARIDEEPNYLFLLKMLRHFSYRRSYRKMADSSLNEQENKESGSRKKKGKKSAAKAEKPAPAPQIPAEEEDAAQTEKKGKKKVAPKEKKYTDIREMTLIRKIDDDVIIYGRQYFGAVIEIPAVEFRFFSEHRRSNAIDQALGSVIRNVSSKYAANLIKIERPMILDEYIREEYRKVAAMKQSYERGVFTEEELLSRIEIINDRIEQLSTTNYDDQILVPHFYLALFDSDKRHLNNQVSSAIVALQQGEMTPHRLSSKELAVFLRYTNSVDFDERQIEDLDPKEYVHFMLPESLELKGRTAEINQIITHNFRVSGYPLSVDDAWGAALFDIPGTKVVMKFSQQDRTKSIRTIDRSISELQGQLEATSVSSRVIELQTHIDTLSELLVMLQNNNESLMAVNMYVTAYDIAATREQKPKDQQPPPSVLPRISGIKKDIKRAFSEQGFRVVDLMFEQFEAYVATQVNGYDPFASKARGIPSSTVAAVFPWVFANLKDSKGLNLGSTDGVPAFVDFFRRDSERVNSNIAIIGKSGSGKSYATKSLLSNLAADDTKIFVLDPENEYGELAQNLNGKCINVANASQGRINPFHIITSLEDDEGGDGQETSSYAGHLQFLEEFFRQILPDVDADSMEYLNNLINRVYMRKNIDRFTNLAELKPEDYPVFDELYDCILEEFQHTKSDYLKSNLRILMNHVAKFSTGGRNAGIWNGPSTLSTAENFTVFNFQSLLANRNNLVANAQMLLVLKYLDNEIIKNREYNRKYGADRKIVIVIDEAHVFIDAKYPLALDFMYQLAKRIRKYNGMQIVITQNIKDFVGSEELARKSTAIINACQYSFIFSLAPNDMHDLCTLYEKAGGINESEQEQIISAGRGSAFVVTSPTKRARIQIETTPAVEEMFTQPDYQLRYYGGEDGRADWEELLADSRAQRQEWELSHPLAIQEETAHPEKLWGDGFSLVEIEEEEEEVLLQLQPERVPAAPDPVQIPKPQAIVVEETYDAFSPEALQRYGFEALVSEIRRTVRQELEKEMGIIASAPVQPAAPATPVQSERRGDAFDALFIPDEPAVPVQAAPEASVEDDWFGSFLNQPNREFASNETQDDDRSGDPNNLDLNSIWSDLWGPGIPDQPAETEPPKAVAAKGEPVVSISEEPSTELNFNDLFTDPFESAVNDDSPVEAVQENSVEQHAPEAQLPDVEEITLEQLLAMED